MKAYTLVRFFEKVDIGEHCWTWTGATAGEDYGVFWLPEQGRMDYAHRISHELFVGPIDEGLEIDHLCSNRVCVKPTHLEAVSGEENRRRARERRTKTCSAGHPLDDVNTYLSRGKYPQCRTCSRKRSLASYYAKKADGR